MHTNSWIRAEVLQPHTQTSTTPSTFVTVYRFVFSSYNIYSELKLTTNMSVSIIRQAFVCPLQFLQLYVLCLLIYVVAGEGNSFPFAWPALLIFTFVPCLFFFF